MSEYGIQDGQQSAQGGNRGWKILSLVLLVALIAAIIIPFLGGSNGEEVVATVNGVEITKQQYYEAMVDAGGRQTLEYLIENQLVRQEAEEAGISVTAAEVEEELAAIKASFGSDAMFEQALAQYGMNEENFKKDLELQVVVRKLLEPNVTVTDEDVAAYYDTNKSFYAEEEQVRASHILVETEEEARELVDKIKGGEDFAELAAQHSLDEVSKGQGGDLDYFPRGIMDEAFEEAAFTLAEGEISDPVESSHGFHIIQVTDHKAAYTPTLDEMKDDIRKQLVDEEITMLSQTWLEETKADAKIEKNV